MTEIKKEIDEIDYDIDVKSEYNQAIDVPAADSEDEDDHDDKKELDLNNIDMMQIPIQLGDGMDILNEVK